MVRTAVLQPVYGFRAVRSVYVRNLFVALSLAVVFHLLFIGGYYAYQNLGSEDEIRMVRLIKYEDLPQPRSIIPHDQLPSPVNPLLNFAKPKVGLPVAVPDAEVDPGQTIKSQTEMSQEQALTSQLFGDKANAEVRVDENFKIEDEPSPEDFIAVEKYPVAIRQISPEYPEIARRASVEGTVWVKVLVDKEGHAKKVIILKSDAEIFNESAINAAKQWLFTPAIMNNGPIAVWVALPFKFKINK